MIVRVGQVIAKRRKERGLDIPALAESAEVSPEHTARLEAGELGASTVELERLAAFLELDYSALLRGEELQRAQPSIFLRHHANPDFHDVDMPVLDAALGQGRALEALCRLLELPRPARFDAAASFAGQNPARQGYALARQLRRSLGLGGAPLGDARAFAEEVLEVAVLVRSLSSLRVTALAMRSADAAVIVLNELDPDRRRNPTLARVHIAHELCHLLHDFSDGGLHLVADIAFDRRAQSAERTASAEQRANGFAAELLLPEEGLRERLGQPGGTTSPTHAEGMVREARTIFGTPNEIAVNHLVNLGFIDLALREMLLERPASLRGPKTSLPLANKPSRRVRALIERAHRGGLATDGQAREVLGLDFVVPLPWHPERA